MALRGSDGALAEAGERGGARAISWYAENRFEQARKETPHKRAVCE